MTKFWLIKMISFWKMIDIIHQFHTKPLNNAKITPRRSKSTLEASGLASERPQIDVQVAL